MGRDLWAEVDRVTWASGFALVSLLSGGGWGGGGEQPFPHPGAQLSHVTRA